MAHRASARPYKPMPRRWPTWLSKRVLPWRWAAGVLWICWTV